MKLTTWTGSRAALDEIAVAERFKAQIDLVIEDAPMPSASVEADV
jgi:hypothetical protein